MGEIFREDFSKRFVNPYNFVPLMGKCERSLPELNTGGYTGYFDCKIKLLTPLFIPNTSSSSRLLTDNEKSQKECQNEQWKGYDFYSYDDWSDETAHKGLPSPPTHPVIPGSELKGAVRSVYEGAFNGCMSSVTLNRVLSRRTNEAKKPGILKKEDGNWVIYPCKKAMLFVGKNGSETTSNNDMGVPVARDKYDQWKEGQELWINLGNDDYKKKIGSHEIKIGDVIEIDEVMEDSNGADCNAKNQSKRRELRGKKYIQGWLHKGEAFSRKHHESVFYYCDTLKVDPIRVEHSSDLASLEKILEEYRDPKKNRMAERAGGWYSEYRKSPDSTLVYYCKDAGGHVYLSPACIGREVFTKTIGQLLENNGGYEPCTGQELCPACRIFGMVGQNGTYAYGSKVRVSDAVLAYPVEEIGEIFENPVILPELGEPKPGTVEFYTKSPYTSNEKKTLTTNYWTYDYKHVLCEGGNKTKKIHLDEKHPQLRGRKFYWHSSAKLKKDCNSSLNKLSAMKQRIRPIRAGNPDEEPLFCFRLYFERLSRQQLRELKWALDFDNKDCAHKIGRAKPLGFGSAQVMVNALYLREIDDVTGNWALKEQNTEEFFVEPLPVNEAMKTLLKMANWKERPDNVQYPSVNADGGKPNSSASHQWFKYNKGNISKPSFLKVLPEAKDDAIKELTKKTALYALVKK